MVNKKTNFIYYILFFLIVLIQVFFCACGQEATETYYPDNYGIITSDTAVKITFQYFDENNDVGDEGKIFLTGDMNNWSLSSTPLIKITDKTYSVAFTIIPDTYFYRYIINGKQDIAQEQIIYSYEDDKIYPGRKININKDDSGKVVEDKKTKPQYHITLSAELDNTTKEYTSINAVILYNFKYFGLLGFSFPANQNGFIQLGTFLKNDTYCRLIIYKTNTGNNKGYSLINFDKIYIHNAIDTFIGNFELKHENQKKSVTITHVPQKDTIKVLFLSSVNNYGDNQSLYNLIYNTPDNVLMKKDNNGDTYSITVTDFPGLYNYYFYEIKDYWWKNWREYDKIYDTKSLWIWDYRKNERGHYFIIQ